MIIGGISSILSARLMDLGRSSNDSKSTDMCSFRRLENTTTLLWRQVPEENPAKRHHKHPPDVAGETYVLAAHKAVDSLIVRRLFCKAIWTGCILLPLPGNRKHARALTSCRNSTDHRRRRCRRWILLMILLMKTAYTVRRTNNGHRRSRFTHRRGQ